jgi:hypothetical protein
MLENTRVFVNTHRGVHPVRGQKCEGVSAVLAATRGATDCCPCRPPCLHSRPPPPLIRGAPRRRLALRGDQSSRPSNTVRCPILGRLHPSSAVRMHIINCRVRNYFINYPRVMSLYHYLMALPRGADGLIAASFYRVRLWIFC